MANILLTGGSGFVGTAVREAAARRGIAVDAPPRAELDILRPESLVPAMEGVEVVVHAAGAAHVFRQTPATARWTAATNADGTRNVVAAARAAGVRRVVLIGSVAVYREPHDVYAASKAAAERAAIEEARGTVQLTMLRLATLYGEGDPGNVYRLIRAIDRHRFVAVGRGENRKSLIHRDDVGAAIVAALGVEAEGIFDVSAPAVTMAEVVSAVAHALGRRVPRLPLSRRAALAATHALTALTLRNRRAQAIERALSKWLADDVYDGAPFCARFGFMPAVALADGIAREVAWYRALRQRA
jgi:nucleoside-diphosphate-sugar epimerase